MRISIDDGLVEAIRRHLDHADRQATPELLDVGFSNTVIRFGGSVVRVARNAEAGSRHELEAALLVVLSDRLPVSLPGPARLVMASVPVEYGAAIHPFLHGRTMEPPDVTGTVATEIATTLAALHAIPLSTVASLELPDLDPLSEIHRLRDEIEVFLRARVGARQHEDLARWMAELEESLPGHDRVLCHADAWFGNMLIDEGRLVALLDWEDACVADPALDLAAQLDLSDAAAEAVLNAYTGLRPAVSALRVRLDGYRLIRNLAGLAYVVRNRIDEEVDDEVAKILTLLDRR